MPTHILTQILLSYLDLFACWSSICLWSQYLQLFSVTVLSFILVTLFAQEGEETGHRPSSAGPWMQILYLLFITYKLLQFSASVPAVPVKHWSPQSSYPPQSTFIMVIFQFFFFLMHCFVLT